MEQPGMRALQAPAHTQHAYTQQQRLPSGTLVCCIWPASHCSRPLCKGVAATDTVFSSIPFRTCQGGRFLLLILRHAGMFVVQALLRVLGRARLTRRWVCPALHLGHAEQGADRQYMVYLASACVCHDT